MNATDLLREHYELCAGSCDSDRNEGDDGCTCLVCRTRRVLQPDSEVPSLTPQAAPQEPE